MQKNEKGQVEITVQGIKDDLNSGMTRADIKEKYSLSTADIANLFKHEELKGLKTKSLPGFVIVNEIENKEKISDEDEEAPDVTEEPKQSSNEEIF